MTLKFSDAETGRCEATLEGHDGEVSACAFSPDGKTIVSTSDDRTLSLWDAETGREVYGMPALYALGCVAVDPTRARLAFGDGGGSSPPPTCTGRSGAAPTAPPAHAEFRPLRL